MEDKFFSEKEASLCYTGFNNTHTFIVFSHINNVIDTHWVLDHFHSLVTELLDNASNIHHSLLLYLIQSTVDGDQCSSPTYTSTESHTPYSLMNVVVCVV